MKTDLRSLTWPYYLLHWPPVQEHSSFATMPMFTVNTDMPCDWVLLLQAGIVHLSTCDQDQLRTFGGSSNPGAFCSLHSINKIGCQLTQPQLQVVVWPVSWSPAKQPRWNLHQLLWHEHCQYCQCELEWLHLHLDAGLTYLHHHSWSAASLGILNSSTHCDMCLPIAMPTFWSGEKNGREREERKYSTIFSTKKCNSRPQWDGHFICIMVTTKNKCA